MIGECVRCRIELELFDHLDPGGVAVFENQRRRPSGGTVGWRALDFVEGAVQCSRRGVVRDPERERKRLGAPEVTGDQLQGLALLVAIVFEAPALETGAAIREDSDHFVGLDTNVALRCGSDQRWRRWRRGLRGRGLDGPGAGLCAAADASVAFGDGSGWAPASTRNNSD